MNKVHLWRSFALTATVLACLISTAHPVSAATHDATVTGGVITLYAATVPQDAYDLAPFVPHCAAGTLELDVTGTGAVGVTDLDSRTVVSYFGLAGNPYLRVLSPSASGSTYGTLTGAGPSTITDMRVGVQATYYDTSGYDDTTCEPTGLSQCSVDFVVELDGTLTGTTPSSTASLTGPGVGTVDEIVCDGDLASLVGSTVAVSTPITAILTS